MIGPAARSRSVPSSWRRLWSGSLLGLALASSAVAQQPIPSTYTSQPHAQVQIGATPTTTADPQQTAQQIQAQYEQALLAQMRRAAAEQGATEAFARQAFEAQRKYLAETAEKSFREEQFPQAYQQVQWQRQAPAAAQPRTLPATALTPPARSAPSTIVGSGVREPWQPQSATSPISTAAAPQAMSAMPSTTAAVAASLNGTLPVAPATEEGAFRPSPAPTPPTRPANLPTPVTSATPNEAPQPGKLSSSYFAPPVHVSPPAQNPPAPVPSVTASARPATVIHFSDAASESAAESGTEPATEPAAESMPNAEEQPAADPPSTATPATPEPSPSPVAVAPPADLQDRIASVLSRKNALGTVPAQPAGSAAVEQPPTVFVPPASSIPVATHGDAGFAAQMPPAASEAVVPTSGTAPLTPQQRQQRAARLIAQMDQHLAGDAALDRATETPAGSLPALSPPEQPQPTQPVAFAEPASDARPLSEASPLPRLQAPQTPGKSVSVLTSGRPRQENGQPPVQEIPGGDFQPLTQTPPSVQPPAASPGNDLRQDPASRLDQIDAEQQRRLQQFQQEDLPIENVQPANPMRDPLQEGDFRGSGILATRNCDDYRAKLLGKSIRDIAMDVSPMADKQISDYEPVPRTWTDRLGNVVATGTMVDLRRGHVLVDTDRGRIRIPYALLSDADWAAVSDYWRIPELCSVGGSELPQRNWAPQTFQWTASALCHKPLYFENVQLERYGHSHGPVLQPVQSTAHFFVSLFAMPYQTAIHPPSECMYALGYYRPGNCAPWLKDPIPISLDGIRRQALFTVGAAYIP